MEIRHDPQNDPSRRLTRSDITRPIRRGVEDTVARDAQIRSEERHALRAQERSEAHRKLVKPIENPEAEGASNGTDRVEVSAAGSLLAAGGGIDQRGEGDTPRAERVAALKAAYERGELNTPARVDLAARRLLGERPDPAQIV